MQTPLGAYGKQGAKNRLHVPACLRKGADDRLERVRCPLPLPLEAAVELVRTHVIAGSLGARDAAEVVGHAGECQPCVDGRAAAYQAKVIGRRTEKLRVRGFFVI